jgi:hypothetical protein
MGIIGRSEAKDYLMKGISICNELEMKAFAAQGHFFGGELDKDAMDKEGALGNLKKAETIFQSMGMDYWLKKTQEVLEEF